MQKATPEPAIISRESFSKRSLNSPELLYFFHGLKVRAPRIWDFKHLYWAAVYYSPDLAEVKAQFHAVKAGEITAGQSPNPNISIIPTYDNSTTPSAWLLGLGLNIPIETNGKREGRIAVARQQSFSAQAQIAGKAWDVRSRVLNAFIDVLIAKEAIDQTQSLTGIQSQINDIYANRAAQGQLPTALASQNQIVYQQTLLQAEQSNADLLQAQARLAGAIGVPVSAILAIKLDNHYPEFSRHLPSRKKALLENPAIASALSDYRAAHENLRLELAKQIPDLGIGPGYEWNNQQGGKISLGLSFNLPIMNNNEGPIAEAEAKRTLAARHLDTVQITVINAIEQAEASYASATRELAQTGRVIGLQQEKQNQLNSMIKQSHVGNLPFLYARNEMQIAQLANIAVKARILKSQALLEDALRQPLFGPVISFKTLNGE
ncbi:MAG: outer membrane protein [Alphaproteobacteria bacterium]|nr:outer membrane protein [Alphaproteobacteria bacterium]